MEGINLENLSIVNLKSIALNKDLGRLSFEASYPYLEKIQKLFKDLDTFDYISELTPTEVENINNHKTQFVDFLNRLQIFDIGTPDSQTIHDNLESSILNFYNSVFSSLRPILSYLLLQSQSKSKDKKLLDEQQKRYAESTKFYEEARKELQNQLLKLGQEKEKIASKRGEIAAVRFGKHFESQATLYSKEAKTWLNNRNKYFFGLLILVVVNLFLYLGLFITKKINVWPFLEPKEFFTLEYGLVNLALLTLLSYAISFASRNYNINSNLDAINKHRKNVSETINDFLGSDIEKEDRTKILEQGTDAMFKHITIGYLPKIESRDDGPLPSILNTILRH